MAHISQRISDTFQGKEWSFDPKQLIEALIHLAARPMQPDLVRAYYYDAIPDDENKLEGERKKLLTNFEQLDNYQLRKGRLKDGRNPTELGKRKQKGVDILLSIDMLSKAYENHYDIAIILSGDDDFLDLVEAIKDPVSSKPATRDGVFPSTAMCGFIFRTYAVMGLPYFS